MAKAPTPEPAPKAETPPTTETNGGALLTPVTQPGPDESPADLIDHADDPPDPAVYEIPESAKLTPGALQGLQRDGIEAYLFGERVRHDAAGRRWDFRREVVGGFWALAIRVQIGPVLLGKSGLPLDRVPSAEGEHELLKLIESMAAHVGERQAELRSLQQKTARQQAHEREQAEREQDKREKAEAGKDR